MNTNVYVPCLNYFTKSLNMILFLNVCQSETYRISAKRNGNFISKNIYIYIQICTYIYVCLCNMYIHSSLFSPHTQPRTQHTQIHQTCHQFSSSAYLQIQGNATWDIELRSYHHTNLQPFQRIVIRTHAV